MLPFTLLAVSACDVYTDAPCWPPAASEPAAIDCGEIVPRSSTEERAAANACIAAALDAQAAFFLAWREPSTDYGGTFGIVARHESDGAYALWFFHDSDDAIMRVTRCESYEVPSGDGNSLRFSCIAGETDPACGA